jgi:DNA ligase-1
MVLSDLAATSTAVAGSPGRRAKVEHLATLLRRLGPAEIPIAVAYLSGELPQGALGVGWAALRALPPAAEGPTALELLDVDDALTRIQAAHGPGSQEVRREELDGLFRALTAPERQFLLGLLSGELRQGAAAGVMADAVARAAGVSVREIRRALLVAGDLSTVATAALSEEAGALAGVRLRVMRPLRPMLAQSAPGTDEALARICPAALEWKLDGARIQVHRQGEEVRVFTRNLADVTNRVPEVVEAVAALDAEAIILDGEVIALGPAGRPRRFQETMGRFGSRLAVEEARRTVALSPFFFDCLHLDGEDLIDRPARERFAILAGAVPPGLLIHRAVVDDPQEAARFLDAALAAGHEGIVVKALDSPYEAGRRGGGWIKVKRAATLDLVVLAAEWGHGRRRGWLSNLHLGARDPTSGFVMLGKTFKGMTDELLAWQTERLSALETHRDGFTVHVRPELVVEVAFDGIQSSSRYPGGMALRFARVRGYRADKGAEETDTIDAVRAMFEAGGA